MELIPQLASIFPVHPDYAQDLWWAEQMNAYIRHWPIGSKYEWTFAFITTDGRNEIIRHDCHSQEEILTEIIAYKLVEGIFPEKVGEF